MKRKEAALVDQHFSTTVYNTESRERILQQAASSSIALLGERGKWKNKNGKMGKIGQTRELLYLQDKENIARARLYNPLAIGPEGSDTVPAHR